jgi:hypothetical protein
MAHTRKSGSTSAALWLVGRCLAGLGFLRPGVTSVNSTQVERLRNWGKLLLDGRWGCLGTRDWGRTGVLLRRRTCRSLSSATVNAPTHHPPSAICLAVHACTTTHYYHPAFAASHSLCLAEPRDCRSRCQCRFAAVAHDSPVPAAHVHVKGHPLDASPLVIPLCQSRHPMADTKPQLVVYQRPVHPPPPPTVTRHRLRAVAGLPRYSPGRPWITGMCGGSVRVPQALLLCPPYKSTFPPGLVLTAHPTTSSTSSARSAIRQDVSDR